MRSRYVLWAISVLVIALGVLLAADCGDTVPMNGNGGMGGDGGTGGLAGSGGVGGTGGEGGIGGDGGSGGMPECETAEDCDDDNECTLDVCDRSSGLCEHATVHDGGECAAGRGGCYGGVCNFVPVNVTFGESEVVFDWANDRCEDLDIPDGPARAVRAEDGEIVIFATHYSGNYLSRGPSFGSLGRVCDPPPLVSAELPTADSYENFEWLWSPYRVGVNWHVLIHNEHHPVGPLPCTPSKNCGYHSITYGVSTDGATTFTKSGAPAHVVAPAPAVWVPPEPDDPPVAGVYVEGYWIPSNIVLGPDSYYYALMQVFPAKGLDLRGLCLMRTHALDEPASWRAWDGTGFNLALPSPYVTGSTATVCYFLPSLGRQSSGSLTYNSYIDRYMHVNDWGQWVDPETLICGFYFTLSTDLIHWSDIQLIARADIGPCADNGGPEPPFLEPGRLQYPSIIDHADSTANFERPGRTPYLYYTRHNGGLDRDLVRVPLTFTLEE